MEKETEVKMVEVDYQCPECKTGKLRPTGQCFATNPPQYPHNCNNDDCDYGSTFNVSYPYINYRKI